MRWMLLLATCCATLTVSAAHAPAVRAGTPMTGSFDAQATQIVMNLAAGDYADVVALFDPTVGAQLPEAALASAWTTYQQLLGAFQSAGQPSAVMRGELTVEQVPVQLANGSGEVRITFHPDGTIAGLFFLKPGVPVP